MDCHKSSLGIIQMQTYTEAHYFCSCNGMSHKLRYNYSVSSSEECPCSFHGSQDRYTSIVCKSLATVQRIKVTLDPYPNHDLVVHWETMKLGRRFCWGKTFRCDVRLSSSDFLPDITAIAWLPSFFISVSAQNWKP